VFEIIVKTFHGFEDVLAEELTNLGATEVTALKRAVSCKGDMKMVYKINLHTRSALRVLIPIKKFTTTSTDELYKHVKEVNWADHMDLKESFAIDSVVNSSTFRHSKYIALKTKDAIVDQFRDKFGSRPNVNTSTPNLRVNVHVAKHDFTISIDTSGESLHKRGYRREEFIAPINEALAAGLILMTGWKGEKTFIDPMCGSGTFLAEAAMIASNTPPQLHRAYFAFKKSKDFNETLWNEVIEEAKAGIVTPSHPILGFDKSFQSVRIAERNIENSGMEDYITIARKAFEKNTAPDDNGLLLMNPPYGERIETSQDIFDFYKMLGDQMKNSFSGYNAWIITSNLEALKLVGLRPSNKRLIFNGALQCKFHGYELYKGTKE
jgi:putative N6-adenine-specific DNA methylase